MGYPPQFITLESFSTKFGITTKFGIRTFYFLPEIPQILYDASMDYPLQLITHEFFFHVLNHGNDPQCIFYDDHDRLAFLRSLGRT